MHANLCVGGGYNYIKACRKQRPTSSIVFKYPTRERIRKRAYARMNLSCGLYEENRVLQCVTLQAPLLCSLNKNKKNRFRVYPVHLLCILRYSLVFSDHLINYVLYIK